MSTSPLSPMRARPRPAATRTPGAAAASRARRSAVAHGLVALSILAASLSLLACGGSKAGASGEQSSEQQAEVRNADFAKCLREHGVNAEVAAMPGGGHGLKVRPGRAQGPGAFEAAQSACARYRPEPTKVSLSPQEQVEQEEAVQRFAKCMREHGIKVEASATGGGVHVSIHARVGEAGAPNPESPGFQRAQNACQKLLPKPPGAGSGPATSQGGGGGEAAAPAGAGK